MFSYQFSNKTLLRLLFFVVVGLSVCVSLRVQCSEYDRTIKASWRRYLPQYHWGVGYAQMMQESAGRPDAVSPVGAVGLAQFMPTTWDDMQLAGIVPRGASRKNAKYSLQAQAYYMSRLNRTWSSKRSNHDRIRLALASYNAGVGNIIKSQSKCGGVLEYEPIMSCLHLITGNHAKETRGYVPAIERHYRRRFGYDMD